jgi:bifunctional DNA-binding transcriptional regulator/antitoxin component of YhaV-PrlF toxin-antitoxin module
MLELIESGVYPGGTVLRVDRSGRAVVPFETRKRVGVDAKRAREITETSWKPVKLMLEKERGVAVRKVSSAMSTTRFLHS